MNDFTVRILTTGTVREVLINPDEFGDNPVWASVFAEARDEFPGYEARLVRPGDKHEGEDHPTMYDGKFHPQELEATVLEVSKSDAVDFYDAWKEEHPMDESTDPVKYNKAMKDALRLRAKAIAGNQDSEVLVSDRCTVALRRVTKSIEEATKEVAA